MWNVIYPFQLILRENETTYVTRYRHYGEAIAQQIEWEARNIPGATIELLDLTSSPLQLATV
ncbi:hypothetical protein [Spirosoma sp.]|uniref:hypothetical protein n=1 Tax=Spirosoma sp. TaxID=1899569 RepID=UPI0026075ECB|nr:hypothetical protein [Spirosoma sp.]MCX6216506.1 hypothetical protein [Spirosoma sp.]